MSTEDEEDWHFAFESKPNRTDTGKLFRPAKDAVTRWVVPERSQWRMVPPSFWILYQTVRGEFLLADYSCCTAEISRGREIWSSPTPPRIETISALEAAEFLLDYNLNIPDDLAELWERSQDPQ